MPGGSRNSVPERTDLRGGAGGGRLALLVPFLAGVVASLPFQKHVPGAFVLFSLVPFLLILRSESRDRSLFRALRTGWLFGFGFFLALLYWVALLAETEIPVRAIAAGGYLLLSAYLAFFPGLFAAALRLGSRRFPAFLLAPVLWGVLEYLRASGPLGFPWGAPGYALIEYASLVQIARLGGVDAVTFAVVAVNALVAEGMVGFARERPRTGVAAFAAAALLLFGIGLDGVRAVRSKIRAEGRPLRIAVVQPDISAEKKWDEDYKEKSIEILGGLTREAAEREGPLDLAVWPETGVPAYVLHEHRYLRMILEVVEETGVPLLFGFPNAEYRVETGYEYYNSAMLLDREGRSVGEYRKIHLVPFGERLPLHGKVGWITDLNFGEADFNPGTSYTVFPLGGTSFSANICFEAIFPPLIRRFAREGSRFLVNLTNDAWFGTTAAPHQHAAMARMRSVETGLFLARSANTGISLIADPRGRVLKSIGLFERGAVTAEILPVRSRTFSVRHGDWLPAVEAALAAIFLLLSPASRRRTLLF